MKTVVYTRDSPAAVAVASRLVESGKIAAVILQRPMSVWGRLARIRRRISRHGPVRVADELLFQIYHRLYLRSGDDRVRWLSDLNRPGRRHALAAQVEVVSVSSIRSPESRALLARLAPDLVIVASRERIPPEVLALARIGFIGCHPGILPDFGGACPSFWAMREGRRDKIGVSIYLAAAGMDTGPLLAERVIAPQYGMPRFAVESERLMLEGTHELLEVIEQAEQGALKTYTKPDPPGPLYGRVGLTDYLRVTRRP